MSLLKDVQKYKKHPSNTYKNYYEIARSIYAEDKNLNVKDLPNLDDLKINEFNYANLGESIFPINNDYNLIMQDIVNFANTALPTRGRLVPGHDPCARFFDGRELSSFGLDNHLHHLLGMLIPSIEKHYAGCYVRPWYASMSRSIIRPPLPEDNDTTWSWHSDMVPQSAFKLFFYLTNVEEGCAPLTYLVDQNGNPVYRPGSDWGFIGRTDKEREELNPARNDPSRVPISEINKLKEKGYKEKEVYLPAGSFLVWSPNYIHKASFAKVRTRDVIQVQLRPTTKKPESYWVGSLAQRNNQNQYDWWGYD